MTYTIRKHEDEYTEASLHTCVKRFLEILDNKEESESGTIFYPTRISSCRILHNMELEDILKRMREYANAGN